MRLLVTGGRYYRGYTKLFARLDELSPDVIIHGDNGCTDIAADVWAILRGLIPGKTLLRFPADWKAYGKGAGPVRNQQMIDIGQPTHVLAAPGHSGTDDMKRRAQAVGIEPIDLE